MASYHAPSQPPHRSRKERDSYTDAPETVQPVHEKNHVPEGDDDEDMDALIADLESQDDCAGEDDDGLDESGTAFLIPEELLQTNPRIGLRDPEVIARRKKYGLNQMKEEKENLLLKFLGFFVGPIQFVMEASCPPIHLHDQCPS